MILRGWKNICAAIGGVSRNTARRLMRLEDMPVAYLAGTPVSTQEELEKWIAAKTKQKHGQKPPNPPAAVVFDNYAAGE
ncbi:MAG: hypothetical protein LBD82_01490 [Deltaproteobacteria bacterium]|jgi:hypothetical protein|nr:hypothetical protein [Deltaproteobacteria bacterium]